MKTVYKPTNPNDYFSTPPVAAVEVNGGLEAMQLGMGLLDHAQYHYSKQAALRTEYVVDDQPGTHLLSILDRLTSTMKKASDSGTELGAFSLLVAPPASYDWVRVHRRSLIQDVVEAHTRDQTASEFHARHRILFVQGLESESSKDHFQNRLTARILESLESMPQRLPLEEKRIFEFKEANIVHTDLNQVGKKTTPRHITPIDIPPLVTDQPDTGRWDHYSKAADPLHPMFLREDDLDLYRNPTVEIRDTDI